LTRGGSPESVEPGVWTFISTELFNDFKAQAALFKSRVAQACSGPRGVKPVDAEST